MGDGLASDGINHGALGSSRYSAKTFPYPRARFFTCLAIFSTCSAFFTKATDKTALGSLTDIPSGARRLVDRADQDRFQKFLALWRECIGIHALGRAWECPYIAGGRRRARRGILRSPSSEEGSRGNDTGSADYPKRNSRRDFSMTSSNSTVVQRPIQKKSNSDVTVSAPRFSR